MPHIRIFPNSPDYFPHPDDLTSWLLTGLKARGGQYLIRGEKKGIPAESDLRRGSVVLFRHGNEIVGEGVVRDYDHTPGDDHGPYLARVAFVPGSIRVFVPAFPIDALEEIAKELGDSRHIRQTAHVYYDFRDWRLYPKLLATHIEKAGTFM